MRRVVLALLCVVPLVFADGKVKRAAPDYTAEAGRRTVLTAKHFVLEDDKLGKLQCRATFPGGEDALPVIVFCHGLFGSKDAYEPLARFYASHGYAVLQANHPDSLALGARSREEAIRVAWRARPEQVKFLISSFAAIGKRVAPLKDRLDPKRVAVAGHSFGAHTAQLIGGLRVAGLSFRDDRVKCVLCLSPQGESKMAGKRAWTGFTTPALFVTGSKDESPLERGKGGAWRRGAFENAPDGDKYLVWIDGAHHGFGGITGAKPWRGSGPRNEDHVRVVKKTSLAFLDAYLGKKPAARKYLDSTGPVHAGEKTAVTYERK